MSIIFSPAGWTRTNTYHCIRVADRNQSSIAAGYYLPSWIRTKVLLACKASAITRLGEGELVLDKGFEPMTYA